MDDHVYEMALYHDFYHRLRPTVGHTASETTAVPLALHAVAGNMVGSLADAVVFAVVLVVSELGSGFLAMHAAADKNPRSSVAGSAFALVGCHSAIDTLKYVAVAAFVAVLSALLVAAAVGGGQRSVASVGCE